jgi:hypothetical protein
VKKTKNHYTIESIVAQLQRDSDVMKMMLSDPPNPTREKGLKQSLAWIRLGICRLEILVNRPEPRGEATAIICRNIDESVGGG